MLHRKQLRLTLNAEYGSRTVIVKNDSLRVLKSLEKYKLYVEKYILYIDDNLRQTTKLFMGTSWNT